MDEKSFEHGHEPINQEDLENAIRELLDQYDMMVEVEFESGEMFRVRQPLKYYDEYYKPSFGEWFAPLPKVMGNSFAFGLIEMMMQNDDYSGLFYSINSSVKRVKTWLAEN